MSGWKTAPLESVCHFSNGLWKGEKPPFVVAGVIRNTNFTKDGGLDDEDVAFLDVETKKLETRRLQFGDIVLEKSGGGPKQPVGRVVFFDKSDGVFSFSNFTSALRVRDPREVEPRFLHKLLHWVYLSGVTAGMQSHSTGIRNLDGNAYKAMQIAYPALAEQRRIVGILDEAFEGISSATASAEKNLQNARAVFESEREDALAYRPGWDEGPLGDLCDIKHGFAFKGEFFTDCGQFVLLTPGNFFEHGGYRDRGEKQKYYVGEIPDGYLLKKGEMLVAMTEQAAGLLGSPLIVPESGKFLHNQRLGLVVPREGRAWATEFFFHVFNLARVRKEIHDGGTGQKVRHTSPGRICAVRIAYPDSLLEQRAVAERLAEVQDASERLEAIYQQKLDALDELKKSLLHHAFSGAL